MQFFDLGGKKALVTGGSSGIGLAVVQRLASAGADVAVIDLVESDDVSDLGVRFIEADVSDPHRVERAFESAVELLGKLDVVVNNAGIAPETGSVADAMVDESRATIDINLNGVMWGVYFAPGCMNDGGSIINTASAAATVGIPTYAPYAASKAGIVGLTRSAAMDLGPRGIRVNAVCPGTIVTPMHPQDDTETRFTRRASPLGRLGSPDDVVGLYHFLAADESKWMTGQAVYVDGGLSAGFSSAVISALQ